MFGHKKNTDIDEFERREQLRKTYRIPAEQTLAELGEGRGASFFCWRQMAVRWKRTHEVANPVTQVSMAPDTPRDGRRESRRHTVSRFPQRLRHHEHGFVRYLSCAVPQFSVSLCKTTTTSFLISVDAVQLADMAPPPMKIPFSVLHQRNTARVTDRLQFPKIDTAHPASTST